MPTPILYRAPVFAKEAAALFRRRRTYVQQALFLGTLLAALWVFWPRVGKQAAQYGRALFMAFAAIELIAGAIVAPALAAPSIAAEREKETLGLLALGGASAFRIVAGKALGRLAQLIVLVAISLPLIGALFTVGGLEAGEVAKVFVETLALGALGVSLGALFSAAARRPETALLRALGAILGLLYGVPEALAALGLVPAYTLSPVAWYEALFDPLGKTGSVRFGRWWIAPLVQVGLACVALVLGGLRLSRAGYEPVKGASSLPLRRLILRLRKRGGPLGLTGRFGTEVAALRWRERTVRAISDGALAVLLGIALLGFELAVPGGPGTLAVREGSAVALASIATLLATVLGAAVVSRERDQKTLEPLAAAPIDAEQFLVGKLLGIGRAVLVTGVALVLHTALGAARGAIPWAAVVAIAGTLPFGLVLHAVGGLWWSCYCKTTIRATAGSLGSAVLVGGIAMLGCLFYGLSPACFVYKVLSGAAADPWAWLAIGVAAALHAAAVAVVGWNHLRARFDVYIGRAALDIIELSDTMPARPSGRTR